MAHKTTIATLVALAFLASTPVGAQDAGAYLAARQATMLADFDQAARYYSKAISRAPQNLDLQENAIMAYLGLGDMAAAERISKRLEAAGRATQITNLVLNATTFANGEYDRVATLETPEDSLAQLLEGLLKGWAIFGQGQMSDALAAFDAVAENPDFSGFAHYHQALAFAMVGDFEAADEILSGNKYGPLTVTPRGLEAHVQVLIQLERREDALELVNAAQERRFSAELLDLGNRIEAGDEISFDFIRSPQDGASEVLYNLAAIVDGRAAPETVLIYARLAQHLSPNHAQALLLIAEILEDLNQFDLASEVYADVPIDNPVFFLAEMGRADALYADDHKEAAVEVLTGLSKSHADIAMIHAALGDMLSRVKRDDEAIAAYDKSLSMRDASDVTTWPIFYARGIVHERQDNNAAMEIDFRKALELSPNQPDVLNYLGYSLVEQNTKLDEALSMIETAVAERPNSGYIADSLGWVFYRLERFDEAVAPMEKAVSLLPVDPIVNDHLGDVYYKVGRIREAEFQWKRALSFEPEDIEADRIRRKIEVGLEQVLLEESDPDATKTANE